jgi:hypothetical protein
VGHLAQPTLTGLLDTGGFRPGHSLPHRMSAAPDVFGFVTSRLRQSPAYPSGPIQHARLLQVGVPRTGHAVLWKLTIGHGLDHGRCQSEDVNSHQLTVTTKLQYLRTRTGAPRGSEGTSARSGWVDVLVHASGSAESSGC